VAKKDAETSITSREVAWISFLRGFDDKASLVRSLVLNSLLIAALVFSLPILFVELTTNRVVIAPLSAPPQIEQLGLTGTVAANRLWDAWSKLNDEVAVAKETRDVLPSSQRIEFAIPDSGLSFDSFIHHLRSFFGYHDTTLSGELVCDAEPCSRQTMSLRLRVLDGQLHVIELPPLGSTPENTYWRKAINEVMAVVDPVRGILAARVANAGVGGTDERAIAALQKLVRSNSPDATWALAYAGSILSEKGDALAARASFDQALKRDPKFAFAWRLRANADLRANDTASAEASIAQALRLKADDAPSLMQLALIKARKGETAAAEDAFARAAAIQPNWPQIPLNLGAMYTRMGDNVAAKAAYQRAIDIDPDFVDAHELLALSASLDKDYDTAISHQRVIVRLQSDNASVHDQLGSFLEGKGDLDAALVAYSQAAELAPDVARYTQRQGLVLMKQKKTQAALQKFLEAQKLDGALTDLWFNIADAYRDLGQHAEAKAAYQNYLQQEPKGLWVPVAQAQLKFLEEEK
jgi:tetratricopeptide (TPR) repeat protein